MTRLLIIIGILVLIAGMAKGISDALQFHYDTSFAAEFENRDWWDPSTSWTTSVQSMDGPEVAKYEGGDPKNGAAFPGSTTIFVFMTDAWHLFQMIEARAIDLALTLLLLLPTSVMTRGKLWPRAVLIMVGLFVVRWLGFSLWYSWL